MLVNLSIRWTTVSENDAIICGLFSRGGKRYYLIRVNCAKSTNKLPVVYLFLYLLFTSPNLKYIYSSYVLDWTIKSNMGWVLSFIASHYVTECNVIVIIRNCILFYFFFALSTF